MALFWGLQGVAPFGASRAGTMGQQSGAPIAVVIGGGVSLLTAAAIHLFTPELRYLVA